MRRMLFVAAFAAAAFPVVTMAAPERGDYGLYERFLASDAAARRAMLDDASLRPALAIFGTPPPAVVSAVPRWYEVTANMRDLGGMRTDRPVGGELEFRFENGGLTHPVLPREF